MKRFSPLIEALAALILLVQLYIIIAGKLGDQIPLLIIEIVVYGLLTLLFSYMLLGNTSYNISLGKLKVFPDSLPYEISEGQKDFYMRRSADSLNLIKLVFVIFMSLVPLLKANALFFLILVPAFIAGLLFSIYVYTKYSLYSRGYIKITPKEIWRKYIFYYNPNDNRAVLDKPIGAGSTVNLATPQGRVILGIILGIPITLIILLFTIFYLTGSL